MQLRSGSTLQALFLGLSITLSSLAHSAGYTVETLADDLDKPWSIAFLPGGDLLVTEKPGALRRLSPSGQSTVIAGVPPVHFDRQGGLLEVALDPDFETSHRLYLSYASGTADANRTTVARARLEGAELVDLEVILEVEPTKAKGLHFGGKLAFLPDGTLLVSVGEGYFHMDQAQSLDSELGKLLRINTDGSIPADNPFLPDSPRVYSYGHRNPQGLAIHPETGEIFMTEHGPKGGDEINLIKPGNNYGWPAITYGVGYDDEIISPHTKAEGMEQPLRYWVPSIATSGLTFYAAEMFPEFRGDAFVGALADRKLYRLDMEGSQVLAQSEPFPEVTGRVRDVRVGPDGALYAVVDEGQLYRISR